MSENGGHGNPTTDNIHLAQSWIVSQYKHEYNPVAQTQWYW